MSKRNLIIAAALLIIIAIFVNLYSKKNKRPGDSPIGKQIARTELVETIDEIVIEKQETALHLHKKAHRWLITEKNEFPANTQKLVELLDSITTYRLAALVTKDKDRLAHFGLLLNEEAKNGEGTTGTQLVLKSKGKVVFKMIAGKNRDSVSSNPNLPSRPDGTYVRIGETAAVYLVKENINFETQLDAWVQKVLITMNKDQIKSVQFESPGSRLRFERENSDKKLLVTDLSSSEITDEEAVKEMLDELETLSVYNAIQRNSDLENRLGLKSEISVTLFDGSKLNFQILVKTEKKTLEKDKDNVVETHYLNLLSASPAGKNADWKEINELGKSWLFELEKWQATNWLKTKKDFTKARK